jgi:hypothetical protein
MPGPVVNGEQFSPGYTRGAARYEVRTRTHLLVDWRYVACRKAAQRGTINASRNPAEVTCPSCKRARPAEFTTAP